MKVYGDDLTLRSTFLALIAALAIIARPDALHRGGASASAAQTPACAAGVSLQGVRQLTAIEPVRGVASGDFNGDGAVDLALSEIVLNLPLSRVSIWFGDGRGSFENVIKFEGNGGFFDLDVGDLNGDGKPDFALSRFINVSANSTEGRAQLFLGDGAGRFAAGSEIFAPMIRQVSAADLNGDRLNDLVFVSSPQGGGGNIWSILAQCSQPPAASDPLASVSAASFRRFFLASESIVAAFSAGLSAETAVATAVPLPTQLAGTSVKVKDSVGVERLSPLFFVSPNQINYQMPPGTATGPATVTVTGATGNTVSAATRVAAIAPGLFTANSNGQGAPAGVALRLQPDGRQIFEPLARFDPASNQFVPAPINLSVLGLTIDRVFLILFGTGMRGGAGANVELRIGGNGSHSGAPIIARHLAFDETACRLPKASMEEFA